jgi:hypothetical protein
MGLLDNTYLGSIFDDWKKQSQGMDGFQDYTETEGSGSLETAGGKPSISPLLRERKGGSPLTQPGGQMFPTSIVPQNVLNKNQTNKAPMPMKEPSDPIVTGGQGTQQADMGFLQRLSNMAGVDMDKAMATWKDKGGFEGLMANPAFTIGLAFLQAGAEGKTLGQGALDNVLKAGAISQNYKKIIADRKQAPIQATSTDIAEVKSLLETMNIEKPNVIERIVGKVKGKNVSAMFDIAAEDIAIELQKEMQKLQSANKTDKPLVFDTRRKLQIIERLIKENKFKKKGGIPFVTSATLESDVNVPTREHGGPVQAGKPYVVGEVGPEIIIPTSDGNVLSNDDSQIFNMLLASNPQLQKVSRQRAEKVLRSRFPEYFEG